MGGKNSKEIEQIVRNEISITITNHNETINSVATSTITDVTNNVMTEQANSISATTSSGNDPTTAGNVMIAKGKGSTINLSQSAKVKSMSDAIAKLSTSKELQNQLQNSLKSKFDTTIDNDNKLAAAMDSLSALKKEQTNSGGIEGVIAKVTEAATDMVGKLTGTSTDEQITSTVTNQMKMEINNTNINKNELKSDIENILTTNVGLIQKQQCDLKTLAGNRQTTVNNMMQAIDGGSIEITQELLLESVSKCLLGSFDNLYKIEEIKNVTDVATATEATNKTEADANLKSKSELVDSKVQTNVFDTLVGFLKTPGGIFFMIMLLIGLIVGGYLYVNMKTGGAMPLPSLGSRSRSRAPVPDDEDEDEDQYGGSMEGGGQVFNIINTLIRFSYDEILLLISLIYILFKAYF